MLPRHGFTLALRVTTDQIEDFDSAPQGGSFFARLMGELRSAGVGGSVDTIVLEGGRQSSEEAWVGAWSKLAVVRSAGLTNRLALHFDGRAGGKAGNGKALMTAIGFSPSESFLFGSMDLYGYETPLETLVRGWESDDAAATSVVLTDATGPSVSLIAPTRCPHIRSIAHKAGLTPASLVASYRRQRAESMFGSATVLTTLDELVHLQAPPGTADAPDPGTTVGHRDPV